MGLEADRVSDFQKAPEARPTVYTGPGWNLAQRIAFRFAFAYLILYILPFPLTALQRTVMDLHGLIGDPPTDPENLPFLFKYVIQPTSKYVTGPYQEFWDEVVLRTGRQVFDKEIEYRPMGSGDTTWNYVQLFAFAVMAAGVALVWSLAAWGWRRWRRRSRLGYPHLHEWLRVFVRFYLAYQMIVYGAMKVIKLQFAYPSPDRILETYGESSPMRLLWTFMGASDWYTWFTGAGELLAGLLLCTRRTTLLGALVTFGVMIHVFALNVCYDVPVKLFSSHLVLLAVFLMVPDLSWMSKVFLLGKPATPRGYTPLVRPRWLDWTLFVSRTVILLAYLTITFLSNYEASKLYGRLAPEPPLYGLWEVEEFRIDDKVRPPLTTDGGRWQRVVFNKARVFSKAQPRIPTVTVWNMPGKFLVSSRVAVDEEAKTITLTRPSGPPGSGRPDVVNVLRYTEVEPGVIEVEGEVPFYADGRYGPKKIKARLRHYGTDQFLLSSRGFRWINETPYNQYGPKNEPPPPIMPPPKR